MRLAEAPKQPTAGAEHSSWVCQNVEAEVLT